jgi:HSP20 family molecular chaperone IbpA
VTVEIEKIKQTRAVKPQNNATVQIDEKALEQRVKEDFGRLIKDIFGNPQVKAQIQQNVQQMQQELQQGLSEFQKAMIGLSAQLQQASESDPLLKELFQSIPMPKALAFKDEGSRYRLDLDVPTDPRTEIDVKVKDGFVIVSIKEVITQEHEEQGVIVKKDVVHKRQVVVTVPQDALVEKLQTRYENGKLEITIPKIAAKRVAT